MKTLKTKWHWFWYRIFLHLSVKSADLSQPYSPDRDSAWHKFTFARSFHHSMKVHQLDPVGLARFADACVARAFPIPDWDVE